MARSIRIEYPGAFYHVMARGNRREHIYRDEVDRRFFLQVLSEACEMTGWRVHAWVLERQGYWPSEFAELRRKMREDIAARASGAAPR